MDSGQLRDSDETEREPGTTATLSDATARDSGGHSRHPSDDVTRLAEDEEPKQDGPSLADILSNFKRPPGSIDCRDEVIIEERAQWPIEHARRRHNSGTSFEPAPIEEVDEDTLREVMDESGFPRQGPEEPTREEQL